MRKTLLFTILLAAFISSCKSKSADKTSKPSSPDSAAATTKPVDSVASPDRGWTEQLRQLNQDILSVFKNRNYSSLENFIDPELGLRFTPYRYGLEKMDVVLSRKAYLDLVKAKQKKMNWGEFDGTGDPIQLTFEKYVERFVYDADFLKPEKFESGKITDSMVAAKVVYNTYKDCYYTYSYFSGFEQKYEGMDWRSLRLVFNLREGKLYLAGIIHDEWTI